MKNTLTVEELTGRKKIREFDTRGFYFRDQTAIIHSMPYRRLKHKTQVFFSPENDHICTRIEHVQHVATIASTICKGLNNNDWELDSEMAYAIGLGHDLGHAPFGHAGETSLSKCLDQKFMHELNSYRVVNCLANDGHGLNLTYAVMDGIICHNGEVFEKEIEPKQTKNKLDEITERVGLIPSTLEGCIVRFSDKIAYLGRDIEDAIVSKLIKKDDIPESIKKLLGTSNGEIINALVEDVISESTKNDKISFSEEIFQVMKDLRKFNYERIYDHQILTDYKVFVDRIISTIYNHLISLYCKYGNEYEHYEKEKLKISRSFGSYIKKMEDVYLNSNNVPNQILSDYISGMTDTYAIDAMKQISIPQPL